MARAAVGLEGVRLPPATVERQHQRAVQVLAQRLHADRRLELRDQVGMAPERELCVGPRLEGRPAALLQTQDLGLGERLERQIGERRAPPQIQCEPERLGGLLGRGRAAASDQVLETIDIALIRADVQPVGTPVRLERAVTPERLAQRRDLIVEHLRRGHGRRSAPQLLNQTVASDQFVGPQDQQSQQRTLATAPDSDRRALVANDVKGAEQSELQRNPTLRLPGLPPQRRAENPGPDLVTTTPGHRAMCLSARSSSIGHSTTDRQTSCGSSDPSYVPSLWSSAT